MNCIRQRVVANSIILEEWRSAKVRADSRVKRQLWTGGIVDRLSEWKQICNRRRFNDPAGEQRGNNPSRNEAMSRVFFPKKTERLLLSAGVAANEPCGRHKGVVPAASSLHLTKSEPESPRKRNSSGREFPNFPVTCDNSSFKFF